MPLQEKNTRNPARPYKYYQFGQIVKETNRQIVVRVLERYSKDPGSSPVGDACFSH